MQSSDTVLEASSAGYFTSRLDLDLEVMTPSSQVVRSWPCPVGTPSGIPLSLPEYYVAR